MNNNANKLTPNQAQRPTPITAGPWSIDQWGHVIGPDNREIETYGLSLSGTEAGYAHRDLLLEAGTVYHETGLTPRQLMQSYAAVVNQLSEQLANNNRIADQRDALFHAINTLVQSLEWECKRSGTTYNGFENARAAIAKVSP